MADATQLALGSATAVNSRRLIVIAWLFSAIVLVTLAFSYYGIGILGAGRAYVGGEGLWSKAQKDMVYALARYASGHRAADRDAYLASRAVILGDRQARLELDKSAPDLDVARAGFRAGRNHPDDIDGMIRLFTDFRHVPDIGKAIGIWAAADHEIDQLDALAARIHAAVQAGPRGEADMQPLIDELFVINQRLRPLEDAFSSTLGEAARKTQLALIVLLFTGVSVFLLAAFVISTRLVRQNAATEMALRQGEAQLRGLLQFAPLPMIIARIADRSILFANDHALRQFKMATGDGARSSDFYVSLDDRDILMRHLQEHRSVDDWEVRLKDAHGDAFWASMSSQCILYYGEPCVLTALSNIDVRKRNQQDLHRRAFHDELTGLPNRAMFMASLDQIFAQMRTDEGVFALMFLDVDRFKVVNDELGHGAGDKLLQEVANRLRACVAQPDLVARLGGDEFVILVAAQADAGKLHDIATAIMAAMLEPVLIDGHGVGITVSIGISRYPQDGADLTAMMKSADRAMYRAKESGRNNFQWCACDEPAPPLELEAPLA